MGDGQRAGGQGKEAERGDQDDRLAVGRKQEREQEQEHEEEELVEVAEVLWIVAILGLVAPPLASRAVVVTRGTVRRAG